MSNPPWAHNNQGRNGLVRHGACGLVWYQTGEATSHCTRCHATFTSLESFDRHFVRANGKCMDPEFPVGLASFEAVPVKHPEHETVTCHWRLVESA